MNRQPMEEETARDRTEEVEREEPDKEQIIQQVIEKSMTRSEQQLLSLLQEPQQQKQQKNLEQQSIQSYPLSLSIYDDQEGDEVTIVSATSNPDINFKKRRKKRRRARKTLQIDSKQQSVEQIRQQAPKPCIQLEPPEPIDTAPEPDLSQLREEILANPDFNNDLQSIHDIMNKQQQQLTAQQITTLFARLIVNKATGQIPQVLEMPIKDVNPQPHQSEFQNLFQEAIDRISRSQQEQNLIAFATTLSQAQAQAQIQLNQGEIMQIPKLVAQIPKLIPLIGLKHPQICQQFIMITFYDLITGDDEKMQLRKLIKSNYKQQILHYTLSKLMQVDASYNYANLQILKMIKSGYVWDNVIPFMAERLYKDYSLVKVRLLPEKSNNDSVSLIKYQAFLVLCEMFFGILPRQISTYDLPISFGEIMTIGENDSAITIENKIAKLKCVLHYFSNILREKEDKIKNSVEFIAFQRFRVNLKAEALYPQNLNDRVRYHNLRLTDHLSVTRVKYGNEYLKETAVYLTHENPCRESGEETLQTPFLMQETYRMMYAKPEMFILKALTPKLDLGEAIIVHGLETFSKCHWQTEKKMHDELGDDELGPRKFICDGLFNQIPDYDTYGKRKGTVILIMSKVLFNQTYIKNDKQKSNRITENYSFRDLKIEIETLYSAFQGRKVYCSEDERILISQRYIKFIEEDIRWLYFMIVWIASSISKVKCVFEFKRSEDESEAVYLMQGLEGWSIQRVFDAFSDYRETLLEAHENWNRQVQRTQHDHPVMHSWNYSLDMETNLFGGQPINNKRASTMTFLDFLKEQYL